MVEKRLTVFRKLVSDLRETVGDSSPRDETGMYSPDAKSHPIGGEAYNLLASSGGRLVRLELHGSGFEDPDHVDIRTGVPEIAAAVRNLFSIGRKYDGIGHVYLYDERDQQKDRETLK